MNHVYIYDLHQLAEDVYSVELAFEANQNVAFHPGQYLLIQNKLKKWTPYSIASCPSEDRINLIIKLNYNAENIKYFLEQHKYNHMIEVSLPHGNAYPRTNDYQHFVCIANGMGIAPVKSIVDNFKVNNKQKKLTIYWFLKVGYLEAIVTYFNEMCERYNWIEIYYLYSSMNDVDNMSNLNINIKKIATNDQNLQFLIYGSKDFVIFTNQLLGNLNIKNIYHDYALEKMDKSYAD